MCGRARGRPVVASPTRFSRRRAQEVTHTKAHNCCRSATRSRSISEIPGSAVPRSAGQAGLAAGRLPLRDLFRVNGVLVVRNCRRRRLCRASSGRCRGRHGSGQSSVAAPRLCRRRHRSWQSRRRVQAPYRLGVRGLLVRVGAHGPGVSGGQYRPRRHVGQGPLLQEEPGSARLGLQPVPGPAPAAPSHPADRRRLLLVHQLVLVELPPAPPPPPAPGAVDVPVLLLVLRRQPRGHPPLGQLPAQAPPPLVLLLLVSPRAQAPPPLERLGRHGGGLRPRCGAGSRQCLARRDQGRGRRGRRRRPHDRHGLSTGRRRDHGRSGNRRRRAGRLYHRGACLDGGRAGLGRQS